MSVILSATDDGKERLYFRIVSDGQSGFYVERPDKASVHVANAEQYDTFEDQVIAAIEAIVREDEKWHREKNREVEFPTLGLSF